MIDAQMKLSEIRPYDNNPRNNNELAIDKVAKSITEFGFNVPIVVDSANVIICGHTRYLAAQKLGLSDVPVIVADHLSPAQAKAYRIADNRVAQESKWDDTLLSAELIELDADGDLMHDLFVGFDPVELANLLEPFDDNKADFDDNALEDVYQILITLGTEEEQAQCYSAMVDKGYDVKVING